MVDDFLGVLNATLCNSLVDCFLPISLILLQMYHGVIVLKQISTCLIMDNFFLIKCQNSYISYINKRLEKNCWFENWIFKNFVLKIHRSQTDYILFKDRITIDFCMNCILYIDGYWCLWKPRNEQKHENYTIHLLHLKSIECFYILW